MRKLLKVLIAILSLCLMLAILISCTQEVSYKVTFVTGSSDVVAQQTISKGGKVQKPQDPEKADTASQSFAFIGWYNSEVLWDFENDAVNSDITLTAKYQEVYVVKFYDSDKKTVLFTEKVNVGGNLLQIEEPHKADLLNTYEFDEWLKMTNNGVASFENINASFDVYATYTTTPIVYTVRFYNEDKTTLIDTKQVNGGSDITINAPQKTATVSESYTFNKWLNLTDNSQVSLTNITASFDVYASFKATTIVYIVGFYDEDKTTLIDSQVVIGGDEAEIQTPSKAATAQYTYVFDKWLNLANNSEVNLSVITSDLNVYANYSSTVNSYTVTWYNGTQAVETDSNADYGSVISYDGGMPAKESYLFAGWYYYRRR
jgi:hypothetical protein